MRARFWMTPLVLTLALGACDDTTGPGDGDPPVLPAEESMAFDVDFFETSPNFVLGSSPQRAAESNWIAAAFAVLQANVGVAIHSIVPRAIWASALSQTPSFEDGRWHWRFNATNGQESFQSHVIGYEEGGNRVFEVRVTVTAQQIDDRLLFQGTAPIGGTSGEWVFYDLNDGSMVSRVAWSHPETDEWLLSFTALAGDDQDDVLTYHVDGTSRRVSYLDASEDVTIEVVWDAITREGYIIAPAINGGAQACWDSELDNVVCPAP
ncbi:MAG: hypothetical protein AAF389_02795 [Gemmatimonadota bacterium]